MHIMHHIIKDVWRMAFVAPDKKNVGNLLHHFSMHNCKGFVTEEEYYKTLYSETIHIDDKPLEETLDENKKKIVRK